MKKEEYLHWLLKFQWNYYFKYYPYNNKEHTMEPRANKLLKNKLVNNVFYIGMISTKEERVLREKNYSFLYYIVLFGGEENDWTEHKLASVLGTRDARTVSNFIMINDRRKTCDDVVNQMQQKNYKFCDLMF